MPETNEGKKNLKKKTKKKTLSIYFCVFATQLNNCLLQQAAYFINGLINFFFS